MRKWLGRSCLPGLAWLLPAMQPAFADEGAFYIGADAVRTLATLDHHELDRALAARVAATQGTLVLGTSSARRTVSTFALDAGYMFSPIVGIEASWLRLGHTYYDAKGTETAFGPPSALLVRTNTRSRGPALAVVGALPLVNDLRATLRLGAYQGRTSTDYATLVGNSSSFHGSDSKTTTSIMAGAGLAYPVGGHLSVRIDYLHLDRLKETFLGRSFNVDLASAGLVYAF